MIPLLAGQRKGEGGLLLEKNTVGDNVIIIVYCRYEECKTKLTPFLKKVGFNPKTGMYE